MPIQVTCPKCLKRFQVSDKFAGKTGPCPNCKEKIRVPDKTEEVVIHAPADDAPKDRSGQSVLKPITRTETDVTRKGLIIAAVCILAAFAAAFGLRMMGEQSGGPTWIHLLAAFLLAPPLVWAGYQFVYDQELEPYRSSELRNRVLICSGIFALLWLIYAFVPAYVMDLEAIAEMSYTEFGISLCLMFGLGALASSAVFEIEYTNGLAHYGLYLVVTLLLAIVSGVTLAGVTPSDVLP